MQLALLFIAINDLNYFLVSHSARNSYVSKRLRERYVYVAMQFVNLLMTFKSERRKL